MITLHLHGSLERFGGPYNLHVASPRAGARLLMVQLSGLEKAFRTGAFRVVIGDVDRGIDLDESMVTMQFADRDIHIVPSVAGAGGRGIGKVILGIALIGASFFLPGTIALTAFGATVEFGLASAVLGLGITTALSGVAQLLAPTPATDSNEPVASRPSYLFNSGQNRSVAGAVVPVVVGEAIVGSVVASAGIATEELPPTNADGSHSDKFLGTSGRP